MGLSKVRAIVLDYSGVDSISIDPVERYSTSNTTLGLF